VDGQTNNTVPLLTQSCSKDIKEINWTHFDNKMTIFQAP